MKVNNKKEIIDILKKYNLAIDDTNQKDSETFLVICDYVNVNEMCIREPRCIHFIRNTMWVDEMSIEVENVRKFSIGFTSIRYDEKKFMIKCKEEKNFKLECK